MNWGQTSKSLSAPSMAAVAAVLRSMRLEAKLSQRVLAKRLGVSQNWVYLREKGNTRVDVDEFIGWCRACGVKPCEGFKRLLESDAH